MKMFSRLVIVAAATLGLVAGQEMTSANGDILMRTSRQVGVRLVLGGFPRARSCHPDSTTCAGIYM